MLGDLICEGVLWIICEAVESKLDDFSQLMMRWPGTTQGRGGKDQCFRSGLLVPYLKRTLWLHGDIPTVFGGDFHECAPESGTACGW